MPASTSEPLTWEELREVQVVPTPSIANAIETFNVRPRNERRRIGRLYAPDFTPDELRQ